MRLFIYTALWLTVLGMSINKAAAIASGNVGLAVVLSLVFTVAGTIAMSIALFVIWATVDRAKEWAEDNTYF